MINETTEPAFSDMMSDVKMSSTQRNLIRNLFKQHEFRDMSRQNRDRTKDLLRGVEPKTQTEREFVGAMAMCFGMLSAIDGMDAKLGFDE